MNNKVFFCLCCALFWAASSFSQIVNIETKRKQLNIDTTGWFGNFNLGFNLNKNTSTVLSFSGNAQIDYLQGRNRWISLSNYQVIQADGTSFINSGFQHLRWNRPLRERMTMEAFGQIQYNEKLQLQLRGLLGTGVRFEILKQKQGSIYLGVAYMYQYEAIRDTSLIYRDHRLSNYLAANYEFKNGMVLSNTTYFQPLLTDLSTVRIASQTSLSIKITERLALNSRFNLQVDSRLNEVTEGVPTTTYSFINGLSWTF
ncbi:MAG: DUF481 domain-containing protein [Saprospiraceae bacterium]